MEYKIIKNKSTNFELIFKGQAEKSEIIYIASAFIDGFTIKMINQILKLPKAKRPFIKFLTGLYGRFNRKVNLLALQTINNKYGKTVEIKVSEKGNFHWKYYAFKTKYIYHFYIGSANFTNNGFNSDGELLINFRQLIPKPQVGDLVYNFDSEFIQAINISKKDFINDYIERKITEEKEADKKVSNLIKRNKQKKAHISEADKFCAVIKVQHYTSSKTSKKIAEIKSLWEKNDWNYYSFDTKLSFTNAIKTKYLLNIFRNKNTYCMELSRIEDWDYIETDDDGNYFIATKFIGKQKISLTNSKMLKLDELGFKFRTQNKNWKNIILRNEKNKELILLIKDWFNVRN